MRIAIKVLAWYTVLIAVFSIANMVAATIAGQAMRFTPLVGTLNIVLLLPMVALGVLVIIWTRRRG
jgi:hypothetical protein